MERDDSREQAADERSEAYVPPTITVLGTLADVTLGDGSGLSDGGAFSEITAG